MVVLQVWLSCRMDVFFVPDKVLAAGGLEVAASQHFVGEVDVFQFVELDFDEVRPVEFVGEGNSDYLDFAFLLDF